VDVLRIADVGGQDGKVVLRNAVGRRRVGLANPEDVVARAGKAHHVDVSASVLAEGRRGDDSQERVRVTLRVWYLQDVRVQRLSAIVAVDVPPEEGLHLLVPDDVAARDRAAAGVRELKNGRDDERVGRIAVRISRAVHVTALEAAPPEVDRSPPPRIDRAVIDLLPSVLADIADVQCSGHTVEREAPRIAKAVRPDLGLPRRLTDERVVRRHRIRVCAVLTRIDPDELSAQVLEVHRCPERIACAAAVTRPHVEHPVGAELELAAVVVRLTGVRNRDHGAARARIGDVRVGRVPQELVDLDRPDRVSGPGVVDVETPTRRVVGCERHRQEPALASGQHSRHRDERCRLDDVVEDEHDLPALLDDEETCFVSGRRGQVHGRREVVPRRRDGREEQGLRSGRCSAVPDERRKHGQAGHQGQKPSPSPPHRQENTSFGRMEEGLSTPTESRPRRAAVRPHGRRGRSSSGGRRRGRPGSLVRAGHRPVAAARSRGRLAVSARDGRDRRRNERGGS
jgi:hypothetical protein